MAETQFSFEYIVSVSVALFSAYIMQRGASDAPAVIKFMIIPLVVAYVTLQIANYLFPQMNAVGQKVGNYFDNRVLGGINDANYVQVFPPILLVFVLTLSALFFYS